METAVSQLEVERDINLVLNINKSGDLPPADIPYVETHQVRQRKSSSLSRRLTLSQAVRTNKQTATKQNLFQKKRRLVKSIEKCKSDYERGSKEVDALQLMIKTYKETPEFGDGKKFQQELKLVESARCLNIRHSLISSAMDTASETSDYTS